MAIQTQTAPAPRQTVAPSSSGDLTIAEMTRIMDVASVLRRERSLAQQQLDLPATQQMLRERLLEAARLSGDPVTAGEIDIAIEQYFANLHEFSPPESGFETFLAHLYVARGKLLRLAVGVGAIGAILWVMMG